MGKDLNSNLSDMLSEMINRYYTEGKNEQLYTAIIQKIQELVYFMPLKYFGLQEEDCADFLLDVSGRIKSIFDNYDYKYNNFGAYLYPQLSKIVEGYKKKKGDNEDKEKSIVYNHAIYEYTQDLLDNSIDNLYVSEAKNRYTVGNNSAIKRLKAAFFLQPITRRRFFVYFISYSVLMETDTIRRICSLFNFNFRQTMDLTNYFISIRSCGREDIDHAINLRNVYYGRQLYYENKLLDLKYLAGNEDEEIYDKIEKMKYRREVKSLYIQSQRKRVPRTVLAPLLHKSDGAIASYMSLSGKLLEWCKNPDAVKINGSYATDIGISDITAKRILNHSELCKLTKIKFEELNPIDYFHINIPLNS